MSVSLDDFLQYLTDWENEAKVKSAGSDWKYHHFTISTQTFEGLKLTGKFLVCMYTVYFWTLSLML